MNPLRLSMFNVGPFHHYELDIPDGVTVLAGGNGAGKSTILNAVELALFADGARDLASRVGPHADRLVLELEFEHGDETYRARRTCGNNATLALDRLVLPGWESLTRETTAQTQKELERTLGLSRAMFNASAFLGQGNAGMFANLKPAERRGSLGELCDPRGLWPALHELANADRKKADEELLIVNAQIAGLEEQVAERADVADKAATIEIAEALERTLVKSSEWAVTDAQEKLAEQQTAEHAGETLRTAIDAAAREAHRLQGEYDACVAASKAVDAVRAELLVADRLADRVSELEDADRAYHEAVLLAQSVEARRNQHLAEENHNRDRADALREEAAALSTQALVLHNRSLLIDAGGAERCDRCDQPLDHQAKQASLKSVGAELGDLEAAIWAKEAAATAHHLRATDAHNAAASISVPQIPAPVTGALALAREAKANRGVLAERLATLEERAAQEYVAQDRLTDARAELDRLKQQEPPPTGHIPELAANLEAAKVTFSDHRAQLEKTQAELTRAKQRLEQLDEAEVSLTRQRDERDRLLIRLDSLRLAGRCFGRDGVPVELVKNVIPQIEAETNRILKMMPTSRDEIVRLELHTHRELKGSDALRATLDIVVHDTAGTRRYETYSGGERGRLNIALRVALAHVLATRRGAEVRVLCLDEVEYLDALGQQQLVDVVTSVLPSFGKVLLVSHQDGVRDAFERVVDVAAAATLEPVTA